MTTEKSKKQTILYNASYIITSVHLKFNIIYLYCWNIIHYGKISGATICFLCLWVLCTRRVVQIGSKSCLKACLQADFSINLHRVPKVNRSRRLFAFGRAKATVRFMSLAATSVSAVCRTRSIASKALKGFCRFLLKINASLLFWDNFLTRINSDKIVDNWC